MAEIIDLIDLTAIGKIEYILGKGKARILDETLELTFCNQITGYSADKFHHHNFSTERYLILDGSMTIEVEGYGQLTLNKMDLLCFDKYIRHRTVSCTPGSTLIVLRNAKEGIMGHMPNDRDESAPSVFIHPAPRVINLEEMVGNGKTSWVLGLGKAPIEDELLKLAFYNNVEGDAKNPIHHHNLSIERFLIIKGGMILEIEGQKETITDMQLICIQPGTKHRIISYLPDTVALNLRSSKQGAAGHLEEDRL